MIGAMKPAKAESGRRTWMLFLALVACAALLVAAAPASAEVSGNFCTNKWLTSGATCHSGFYHFDFFQIEAGSTNNYPTCLGVDTTPSGGNVVNVCSSDFVDCFVPCSGTSGYAYEHNHGLISDYYSAWLDAAS